MGVGYQVSPLHRLMRLDTAALQQLPQRPIVRGESPVLDVMAAIGAKTVVSGPLPIRSPTVESILSWRQNLASTYRDRLDEALTWDESTTFAASDDVATSGDVSFHYVAAVLDQRGRAALRQLIQRGRPPGDEMHTAFNEAERRGLNGRFPQLLVGARIWLPFERNLIIEEANWDGKPEAFGSVSRFFDEVTAIRAEIADADPSAVQSAESDEASEQILAAAWQTSTTIIRLATLATAKGLPLLTTG